MLEIDVVREWQLDALPPLSFDRTINRKQVHRAAVSEVFITDVRALDDNRVAVAGQLPVGHRYFSDHGHDPLTVDPFLVMEAGRQAGLAGAHELGVPEDVILISWEFDLRITDLGVWETNDPSAELRLDTEFTWTRVRRGRPTATICEQLIFVNGRPAAVHRISGHLLNRDELAALRAAQRGTEPPWTADLVDAADPEAVAPSVVGRRDALNVVLAGLRRDGRDLAARVAPRLANRALFDHSYDHLTMQVLAEAARQLAFAGVGEELAVWRLTGLTGEFSKFAELDAVATVRTSVPEVMDVDLALTVVVEQAEQSVAELVVRLSRRDKS